MQPISIILGHYLDYSDTSDGIPILVKYFYYVSESEILISKVIALSETFLMKLQYCRNIALYSNISNKMTKSFLLTSMTLSKCKHANIGTIFYTNIEYDIANTNNISQGTYNNNNIGEHIVITNKLSFVHLTVYSVTRVTQVISSGYKKRGKVILSKLTFYQ